MFPDTRHLELKRCWAEQRHRRQRPTTPYYCFHCTKICLNVQVHQRLVSQLITDISMDSATKHAIKYGLRASWKLRKTSGYWRL